MAIDVTGWRTGVSRGEYLAWADSVRLDRPRPDGGSSVEPGVAVEVDVTLDGFRRRRVPLNYSLHDARTRQPVVANTIHLTPGVDQWRRRAHVWLPLAGRGRYFVQVALNDTIGERGNPRTREFTIE